MLAGIVWVGRSRENGGMFKNIFSLLDHVPSSLLLLSLWLCHIICRMYRAVNAVHLTTMAAFSNKHRQLFYNLLFHQSGRSATTLARTRSSSKLPVAYAPIHLLSCLIRDCVSVLLRMYILRGLEQRETSLMVVNYCQT